jgi:hypothetical protein
MRIIPLKRLLLQAGALCGLLALLAACANGGGGSQAGSTPTVIQGTATSSTGAPVPSPSPGVQLGPQNCPAAVKDPDYWASLIPVQPASQKVQSVTCGYLKGIPTLQALVTVLNNGSGSVLDVYVYDKLSAATPVQIFKLQGLSQGDAKISGYNSLLTAEVDVNSSTNKGKSAADYTRDLFREFKWSDGAGTLVQVAFPGIFPDLTRYQAEADQGAVNQGQQPWKLSATKTAQALGASLLHWDQNATATLTSGGGDHDLQAVVTLKDTAPPAGNGVTISMTRLEGNTNGGIWIVTSLEASGMTISQPQTGSIVHSTTTVNGTGNAFEGVIGQVTVLDHLYTDIGHASARGATGNGKTTFTTSVTSQPTFKNGPQEGLVMLTSTSNANGNIAGAVIIKVLIQQ